MRLEEDGASGHGRGIIIRKNRVSLAGKKKGGGGGGGERERV